jgi:hypothetical protein
MNHLNRRRLDYAIAGAWLAVWGYIAIDFALSFFTTTNQGY